MARVQLQLPEILSWATSLRIRIYDTNFAGHLAHDRVVSLLHEARARLFREKGYNELDVEGSGIILTDLVVVYKAEAFFADEVRVEIGASDFSSKGCDLFYRMIHTDGPITGKVICEAKTGLVFMDYGTRKVSEIPDVFRSWF
ncbi:thioesterase-like family protein [Leptospira inadai serovar Lyme str. 10]|uniref:Thioesterase-like family protein n=2 Tax=Leptospira inadai serovar Lyme TaxID=293084 RepID=V6HHP7_9LEPT|nr:thioesterase family protein [Leptospira inadai]EQA36000.1 thioesterase-like family protein [Leptospira inadai serovar Lyme str. 10]PNV76848.1 thioesterase [Leptospira inadai serovar Lyme]